MQVSEARCCDYSEIYEKKISVVFPESLRSIQAGEGKTHIGAGKGHDGVRTPTRGDPSGTFPNLYIGRPWERSSLLCRDVMTVQWEHRYDFDSSGIHRAKTEAKQANL